jgi:hypothetical protein
MASIVSKGRWERALLLLLVVGRCFRVGLAHRVGPARLYPTCFVAGPANVLGADEMSADQLGAAPHVTGQGSTTADGVWWLAFRLGLGVGMLHGACGRERMGAEWAWALCLSIISAVKRADRGLACHVREWFCSSRLRGWCVLEGMQCQHHPT